jgi:outer membrane protein
MKKCLLLLLPVLVSATAAHAASDTYIRNGNIYTKQDSWIAEIGGAGASDLFKGQNKNASMLFNFGYHAEDYNVDFNSINYRFYGNNDDVLNVSVYLGSSGIKHDKGDATILKGMDERELSADLGLNADFHLAQGTISTYFQHDISGAYDGYVASTKYFYPIQLEKLSIVPYAGLSYQNAEYVDYYFGVQDKEQTASRKAYKGQGDVSYQLGYKLIMPIAKNWDITQTAAYTRLGSNVADSPLVDNANQWLVGATVSFSF